MAQKKQKKAFALVMALALMGFMVLLIVSLAAMVSMQLKLSKQAMNSFKAKQAAKFSAYQALGQIQSTLGPDQRITANASILSQTVHSGITSLDTDANFDWWSTPLRIRRSDAEDITGPIASNKFWVGVWHSKHGYHPEKQLRSESRENFTQNVMDKAITWLVSGNHAASLEDVKKGANTSSVIFRPNSPLREDNSIKVVTKNSYVGSTGVANAVDDVSAPIVELEPDEDTTTGIERSTATQTRIAWWVADEGQKASLNAIASYDFKKHADGIKYRVQSLPFYSGVQGLTFGEGGGRMYNISLDDDGRSDSGVMIARNANAIDQLDAITMQEGSIPSKMLFHAATCNSKGVLVNVRDGGLKKDLSLGLIQLDGNDDANARTTEKPIENIPDYFPRPYGVSGFFTKTTAYPIRFVSDHSQWRNERRKRKPELTDKKFIGDREFAGHIFGPQMFTREETTELAKHRKQSFGMEGAIDDWNIIYTDKMLWKDPGGALWDQLRSYYNLRSPDKPSESILSARVQTDDRFGAKPVVKRFQVHYVPTLVDYGSQRYGLRLHIIPMLALWNPYDTKLGEDTYYVIRVSARDFKEFHNPIGSFRFAIGYLSGNNYFQSLRDLFTERMKFPTKTDGASNKFRVSDRKSFMQNCFTISKYGLYKNNIGTYNAWNGDYSYRYDPYHGKEFSGGGIGGNRKEYEDHRQSKYGAFALSHPNGKASWFPLGYGSTAPHFIPVRNMNETISGITKYASRSTIFPKDISYTGYNVGDSGNWTAVVSEDNLDTPSYPQILYPSVNEIDKWNINPRNNSQDNLSTFGRVARIPLFLNNLYANLSHGSHASRVTYGNDVLFYGQRAIDAVYTDEKNFSNLENQGENMMQSPDLHFMAYDAKGIDAGATKVFAMKKPINYLGNHKNKNSNNGRNGPNGIIEDRSENQSPYEYLDAMMLPVGEANGGQLGGCFYVDVPHPEMEHNAKYDTSNKPTIVQGGTYQNVSTSVVTLENPYILFDLNEIRNVKHVDINGKSTSGLSIANILVDMEDTSVFPNIDINGGRITPYKLNVGSTPLGYGVSRWGTGYNTVQSNACDTYHELQVSIWIYKKEGMTFEKMRARNGTDSATRWGGDFPDYVPLLAFFKGRRNFMGPTFQSFPNPSMVYADDVNDSNWRYNNWSTPGFVSKSQGGGGGTNRGNLASLTPPTNQYREIDLKLNNETTRKKITDIIKSNKAEDWKSLDRNDRIYANTRHFINWLPLNPRRHSANAWKFTPKNMKDEIGDLIPVSRSLSPIMITQGEASSNSYASKLNNYLQSDSKYIPYGYIFGIPYADDDSISESGAKPIHNRRLFVNGSLLTTYYNSDYNAQEIGDNDRSLRNRTWGLSVKSVIATSIVLNHSEDANRAPYYGLSQMGYKIPSSSDSTTYVGLSHKTGTDVNAMAHLLREEEVVHNIANLSAANLNFGAGKWDATSNWEGGTASFASELNQQRPWTYSYGLFTPEALMAGMPIGNSLCPSRVCPEYTYQVLWLDQSSTANNYSNTKCEDRGRVVGKREEADEKNVIYDLSWHFNDALWDEYFFSTLPYRTKDEPNNFNMGKNLAVPQNPRIQYVCTDHEEDTLTLSDMKYSKEISDKQFEENAGKLWINGPFNVNSTSVDAWKAILSTYYGQTIEGYEGGSTDNTASAPFHRWQAPLNASKKATSNTNITQEETIFTGYRALSDAEIEELAVSIVEHIKDRGPFYSMSDFVNRLAANYSAEEKYAYKNAQEDDLLSLANQEERIKESELSALMKTGGETYRVGHTQKGVLQAAIDATSINSEYHKRYVVGKDVESLNTSWKDDTVYQYFKNEKEVWENWRAVVGPAATGAPTYLMQQDILSRLGSFLTVRSDTFKIRAYGEIRNPVSGVVESKAWCEMVVQRTPQYMDNTEYGNQPADIHGREKELGYQPDMAEYNLVMNETNGGLTKLNQALGRRFKVVSFRWLNDNEI